MFSHLIAKALDPDESRRMTATDLDLSRAVWRRSTYSNNGGQCVEVARGTTDVVAVRDSKDPDGPKLAFTPDQWKVFTRTVKGLSAARRAARILATVTPGWPGWRATCRRSGT